MISDYGSTVIATRNGAHVVVAETKSRLSISTFGRGFSQHRAKSRMGLRYARAGRPWIPRRDAEPRVGVDRDQFDNATNRCSKISE